MRIDIWNEGEYNYRAAYGFKPNLMTYLHEDGKKHKGMLVIPGGGYCMITPSEGEIVAKEFFKKGYDAFVLSYTTDITMSVPLMDQPLKDAARAVRVIRKNYPDIEKLVVCGFSAGGHVVGTLITHYDDVEDKAYEGISARPDAAIFGYPVITSGEFTHIYSIQALIGKEPSEKDLEYYSVEKNVTENTPPCFIWQTATDNLVPVENSYLMADALKAKGVKFAHYVFPDGWHGLSMPNEDFFAGKAGGEYVLEQLNLAIDNVRKGTCVDVSEDRRQELIKQFDAPPMEFPNTHPDFSDIAMWPDLAEVFLNRVL